jgi:predicted kinase
MLADAEGCLTDRRGVIIDATFQLRAGRDRCREIARVAGKPLVFIECRCEPAAVRRRLTERARRNDDPSDADWEVYLEQRRRYEPLAPDEDRLTVQTDTTSPEEALRAVETEMRRRCSS